MSHSLPCSTTAGLLANVPPPLYSAVTPDSSPVRGQSHVRALSSELSTEGMSPAPNNMVAPSTTTTAPGSSQDTSPLSRSYVEFHVMPPSLVWFGLLSVCLSVCQYVCVVSGWMWCVCSVRMNMCMSKSVCLNELMVNLFGLLCVCLYLTFINRLMSGYDAVSCFPLCLGGLMD